MGDLSAFPRPCQYDVLRGTRKNSDRATHGERQPESAQGFLSLSIGVHCFLSDRMRVPASVANYFCKNKRVQTGTRNQKAIAPLTL